MHRQQLKKMGERSGIAGIFESDFNNIALRQHHS